MVFLGQTLCYAIWERPEDDAANIAWHHEMMNHFDPFAVGRYVGESDIVGYPVRHERSFASADWQRLESLRRKWDTASSTDRSTLVEEE
jgi:hypothetical protein